MNKRIIVVGSVSIDHTVYTKELPGPGMTVKGESFFKNIGGKGANQAVQAHLLGSQVFFFAAVGNDLEGQYINSFLLEKGLSFKLKESKEQTGTAHITLNMNNGENQILIVPGANNDILPSDIDAIEKELDNADILLTQLECPIDTVDYLIRKAKEKGLTTVLNTAPYHKLDTSLYAYIDYFVPNEHELDGYVKDKCQGSYEEKARYMVNQGIKNVIVTLGENGSLLVNKDEVIKVNAHKVDAVDTTAAGDSYLGAFVHALSEDKSVKEAMEFASLVSSIAVTKKGAIASLPSIDEVYK